MPFPFASPDRLLARFQRTGDARALGTLFDRTAPELLRIAAWLCGNRTDAEDLLQRTFLTVLTKQGGYDATRRAMPWLCGILGNHCKKLHEQRQLRTAATTLARMPAPASNAGPVRDAADAEFAAAVARVRAELGSPYAEVLDLHLAEGLDAKHIAERLGRPAGTVRTQIVRGLALLRRHLPSGFVAGLVLSASLQAASLAAVRTTVMAHAMAADGTLASVGAGGLMTFGGMLMAKKILWLAPSLLLLLGGGAFWWQQRTAEADAPTAPAPAVSAALPSALAPARPTTAANASPERTERQAAEQPDQPVAEPGFATLVVNIRWADDHTPAANIGLLAKPQPVSLLTERDGLTDARGILVLRRIRPGRGWLTSPFTKTLDLDLAAATVTTLDLDANRTGTIAGTVVDDQQRPVADARLWMSNGNPWCGFEVGCSDAQGRFRLPFADGQDIGARKAGYAPSRLFGLGKTSTEVTLVLSGAGGTVQGRVVDGDNRPIAEARIEIGTFGGWNLPGSTMAERWKHPTAAKFTTDADGAFVYEGVAVGTTEVKAWAPGFGPVSEQVMVDAGRTTAIALVLPRGAVVEGTVRDATGRAIAGATVARVGNSYDFARPRSESGSDGAYQLVDLPAGSVELSAVTKNGKVAATVATSAGGTTTWDPVIPSSAPSLAGRVVGPDGKPLAKVQVGVVPAGQFHANPRTTTGENGAFELGNIEAGTTALVVENDQALLATREVVVPAAEPLVVTLTPNELPTAHLRGRVVDAAGKPLAAFLTIHLPSWRWCPMTESDANGVFHRGPIPPGDYLIGVEAKGYGQTNLGSVHVDAGEDKTLPDVVLARAGHVELELRGGEPARGAMLQIAREDGIVATWLTPDGNRAVAELPPGSYLASMQVGTMRAATSFTLRSEQVTTAVLTFAAAVPVAFACTLETVSPNDAMTIVVRDATGALFDCVQLHLVNEPRRWQTLLPPGTYTVTTRANDGRVSTTQVTVRKTQTAEAFDLEPVR